MGSNQSFTDIQKKYGQKATDYITAKYHERRIYEKINDQIGRLNKNAELQESQDIEFISQQKRRLQNALNEAKHQAQLKKKGALQEVEAKHKLKAQDFCGYNVKRAELQNLQKQVKNKYATERVRMQERVREQVKKHQSGGSTLNKMPEYDKHPDNYRRSLQNQCIAKHPLKAKQVDASELEKKLTWQNYRQNFITILNREQVKKGVDTACDDIRSNLIPGGAPVCC